MFGIFNDNGKLVEQFGSFSCRNDAYRVLSKAVDRCRNTNLHIGPITKENPDTGKTKQTEK